MGDIDLSRLVVRDNQESLLVVGEAHEVPELDQMLDILRVYQPDVISIESRPTLITEKAITDQLESLGGLDTLDRATYWNLDPPSAMNIARWYALLSDIPLYLTDWQPRHPESLVPYAADGTDERFTYRELHTGLVEVLDDLLWKGAGEIHDSHELASWKEVIKGYDLKDEDAIGAAEFYALSADNLAVGVRNAWTALALDSLPGKRKLHVAGAAHGYLGRDDPDIVDIQHLSNAPRRLFIDLTSSPSYHRGKRYPMLIRKRLHSPYSGEILEYWEKSIN